MVKKKPRVRVAWHSGLLAFDVMSSNLHCRQGIPRTMGKLGSSLVHCLLVVMEMSGTMAKMEQVGVT